MIRGDLIKAKTAQLARDHHREVLALGKARARDTQAREKVREHEGRLWREIARASQVAALQGLPRQGERASALHRALKAHQVLSHARGAQREVAGEVLHQVARVVRAKHMVSACEKLRSKERMVRAHTIAERRAEDIDEVALLNRIVGRERDATPLRLDGLQDMETSQARVIKGDHSPSSEAYLSALPMIERCSADGTRFPSASVERPVALAPTLALYAVRSEVENGEVSLRIGLERAGTPLSCRLETSTSGQVGIRMETASPALLSSLERERRGIMSRLAEVGIRVGSIEVRRDQVMNGLGAGGTRGARRSREDDDENVIA